MTETKFHRISRNFDGDQTARRHHLFRSILANDDDMKFRARLSMGYRLFVIYLPNPPCFSSVCSIHSVRISSAVWLKCETGIFRFSFEAYG